MSKWVIAPVVFALAAALLVIGLIGVALLVEGLLSWLRPVDLASAWSRTLAGIGLIGASAGLAALGWLALDRLADRENALNWRRKFVAVVGILLALICLPFAVGIHVAAHGPWLG